MSLLCVASALLLAAEPAPASVPAAPEPAAIAAAERMLDAIDFNGLMTRMVDAMIADQLKVVLERIEAQAEEPLPNALKGDLGKAMEAGVRRMFRDSSANLRRGSALIYARHFTAAEIDRLIEINNDPVMRKSLSAMPEITKEMMALTDAMVEAERPKLERDIEAVVERHVALPDNPS